MFSRERQVDLIRSALLTYGISQRQLAREASVSPPEVNRWVRGVRVPTQDNLNRLHRAISRLIYRDPAGGE